VVFVQRFYIVFPFFVAFMVLLVLDVPNFIEGNDLQYLGYALIIGIIYIIVRVVTSFLGKQVTKQDDGTYKDDNDDQVYDADGNKV